MNQFSLTVHQYRQKLTKVLGYADDELVGRYAVARANWKAQQYGSTPGSSEPFNVYTDDPNCKTCRKKKKTD